MTFRIQIDNVQFRNKPTGAEIGNLKHRLAAAAVTEMTVKQFAEAVTNGRSFSPAVLLGGAKAENWNSQQVFCIDVDNEDKTALKGEKRKADKPLTVDEVMHRCEEWDISPALIYETFSSTAEWQKFRIVFIAGAVITDGAERDCIQLALMEIFPECDTSCKNRDRLFFGGKNVLYINEQSSFEPAAILSLGEAAQSKEIFEQYDRQHSNFESSELDILKKDFDFLSYIKQNFSVTERRSGNYIVMNPCPICGHKDDFVFYPATNTFMCFSANGRVGGTVIDLIKHTKNFDTKQAIDYFKHDLCGIPRRQDNGKPLAVPQTAPPKAPEIPAEYARLFDDNGSVLFDEVTAEEILNCDALYTMVYSFETEQQMVGYITNLRQCAKGFKLAGDFDRKMETYRKQALENLKERRKVQHRAEREQKHPDIKNTFPYIIEHETEQGDIYYTVSCPLLAEHIRRNCRYIITHDRFSDKDRMFWYEDGVYKPINDSILQGYIKAYITAFDITILKMRDVKEVMQDLKTDMRFIDECLLDNNEDIINFRNGLYSLSEDKLLPHTPDIYSTIQIPCEYNPESTLCPIFTQYLYDITGGDNGKAQLLLEYMGACISNVAGYRMKKALFMYGKGDTGKSQAKALTERLLGEENCAAGDLSDLEERFGTSMLYLKRLYGTGDMSFVNVNELKIFKNVTGGDFILMEFKGKNAIRYKYRGLLWFCTNELPGFGGDRGDWVYDRIIAFDCGNVIPKHKQDKRLLDKMFEEREAIISSMLIPAVRRLIANNYRFTEPANILDNLDEYKDKNSPVRTFFKECCVLRNGQYSDGITLTKLYRAFKSWYSENMGRACGLARKSFKKEIAEILNMPNEKSIETRRNDGIYLPITLTPEARKTIDFGF